MRVTTVCLLTLAAACLLAAQSAGGIQWSAPDGWKAQPQRPMRAATYSAPAAQGDSEDGECAIFYFGQGQGGGVQANIDRWVGQFQDQTSDPKTETRTIHGLSVTTVEVAGSYTAGAGPMAPPGPPKPSYKMLAAVVQAPEGMVFFKFTGPEKTVDHWQQAFNDMLNSIR